MNNINDIVLNIYLFAMGCFIPNQYEIGLKIALALFSSVNRQRYKKQEEEVM